MSDAGGPLASASTRREISEVRREILGKIEQEVRTSHFVPRPSDGVREVRLACLAIGDLFEEGDYASAYSLTLHVQQVCKLALLERV